MDSEAGAFPKSIAFPVRVCLHARPQLRGNSPWEKISKNRFPSMLGGESAGGGTSKPPSGQGGVANRPVLGSLYLEGIG